MSIDVVLRNYDPECDFEDVFAFAREIIDEPPYDAARAELTVYPSKETIGKVAVTTEGSVAGFCAATYPYWNRVAIIDYLVVAPEARRQGIGRQLVRGVEEPLRREGIRLLCVQTASWNDDSIRFYERLGYVCRATLPGYFGDANNLIWLDRRLCHG